MKKNNFINKIQTFFLTLILFILLFTLLTSGDIKPLFAQTKHEEFKPTYATVLENKVNIRAGQGLNFEILGQLNKNVQVVVTAQENDWCRIKLPKEALCFVHKDYIEKEIVQTNRLRVRAGKNINSNILGLLEKGEKVEILAEDGEWLRIVPPENCFGWIRKNYLQLSKKEFIPKILKSAFISQKKIEASGTIDDLGNVINRQAKHKLIEGKRILYYLKSDNTDLNHYIYQRVCVNGELVASKGSPYPIINVEKIRVKE